MQATAKDRLAQLVKDFEHAIVSRELTPEDLKPDHTKLAQEIQELVHKIGRAGKAVDKHTKEQLDKEYASFESERVRVGQYNL